LKGFGVDDLELGIIAAGAALHYLGETKHRETEHIRSLARISEESYVWLDRFTIRNLELIFSPHQDAITLYDVLDYTVSPMGSRMLKRWMVLPLRNKKDIEDRLSIVDFWSKRFDEVELISKEIKQIGDLEKTYFKKQQLGELTQEKLFNLVMRCKPLCPFENFACKVIAKNSED